MMLCILFKSLLLPFPYRNKYMEINCKSAAAMLIVNVPAKKLLHQVQHWFNMNVFYVQHVIQMGGGVLLLTLYNFV